MFLSLFIKTQTQKEKEILVEDIDQYIICTSTSEPCKLQTHLVCIKFLTPE